VSAGEGARGLLDVVAATANADKVAEIAEILEGAGVRLLPRPEGVPDVEETGDSLLANARLKAHAVARVAGMAAVADDSGLEVDALGGAPGVWSSRYAGPQASYEDNVQKLLHEMVDLHGAGNRTARFRTVALVAYPDGRELWREGAVDGYIAAAPRGSGGFGYDPVFVPAEADGRTFAEMSASDKHALSHRGRAFRALAAALVGRG
jgi:XTP/dITP diphosphohydrolase